MSFASDLRRVRSRSARFEKVLEARAKVLVVSHNNPDPDSIVSALLLETLLTRVFGISVTIAYSGVIGRAENKALLEYCGIQPVPLREIDVAKFETVALVDTQPGTGNHPFEEAGKVAVVLDHHRLRPDTRQVAFFDVRDHLGSTTTLLHLYWRVWRLELTPKFATAMLYALRSETADMGRAASVVDRRLFKDLYALADLRALSRIVNAKIGVYGDEILFSLRSDDPGALLESCAGGQIPVTRSARGGKKSLQEAVIARLLEELGLKGDRPRNLIHRIPPRGSS